jgi:hypothetical protein
MLCRFLSRNRRLDTGGALLETSRATWYRRMAAMAHFHWTMGVVQTGPRGARRNIGAGVVLGSYRGRNDWQCRPGGGCRKPCGCALMCGMRLTQTLPSGGRLVIGIRPHSCTSPASSRRRRCIECCCCLEASECCREGGSPRAE